MKLNEKDIEKGYWYFRPNENFPPKGILLAEYNGETLLNLTIAKRDENNGQRKKREKNYPLEIPGKLNPVQILWANHINQATFDSICKLNGLISLYIQSNRITDISAISQLTSLKHLALISMTKLEEITSLSKLARLKTLKIENFKKISDFSCLSDLVNLEGLEIDGDMYTAQKINDFGFLKEMTKLKYLTFINSRAKIKDFTPLMNLQNLKMLQCSSNYPKHEFQKLSKIKSLKHIGGNIKELIRNESSTNNQNSKNVRT